MKLPPPKKVTLNQLFKHLETNSSLEKIISFAVASTKHNTEIKKDCTLELFTKSSTLVKKHTEENSETKQLEEEELAKEEKRKAYFLQGSEVVASFEKDEGEYSENAQRIIQSKAS